MSDATRDAAKVPGKSYYATTNSYLEAVVAVVVVASRCPTPGKEVLGCVTLM